MGKGKITILVGAILVLVIGGGVVFLSQDKSQSTSSQVLSTTDQPNESKTEELLPTLEIFSGKIEVKLPNEEFKVGDNGQKIPVGTAIKADATGRAQILFPNKTVTRIDNNSQMTLEDFETSPQQTKINVDSGRIWNRVSKLLGKDDSFESETETLVASVRGTSYGHGIQSDGSNKISVSRSEVEVDCSIGSTPNVNVQTNKKIVTKCTSGFSATDWGSEEKNDEWFKWNIEQDKILDTKYGIGIYDDAPSPTPKTTATPSPKPTVKPTIKPTATATAAPNNTPTPLTISSIEVTCGPYASTTCNSRGNTQLKITGNGYSSGASPTIVVIGNNPNGSAGSPTEISGTLVVNDNGTLDATFNAALYGSYKARIKQYEQTVEREFDISYNL